MTEDPRIGRTRQAVREATLDVLARRGYGGFTVEAVAEAARVARSTIYRHWPARIDLIADALRALNVQPDVGGRAGDARERIETLLRHLAGAFADSRLSACLPALIEAAEHHPEVASFLHAYSADRRRTLVDVIADGVGAGELPAHLDPELAALALSAPIVYCRMMTDAPFPAERVGDLVTLVLGPTSDGRSRRADP